MIAVLMVWVVLTGMPSREANSIVEAAAVSAAKPWYGSSFTIRMPIVRMILHPPADVPAAIVSEQIRITHHGT
jgi:hypothetical protein